LVVGRYLGPAAVGQIGLGLRLVDTFNFVGRAVWRLSLVVFGKVSNDLRRLERVLGRVLSVQIVLLAPLYVGFALIAPSIVGPVFGARWTVATAVFPFLATRALITSMTISLDTAAFTINRMTIVIWGSIAALTSEAITAIVLVPRLGPKGYGISELTQTVGVLVLVLGLRRIFKIDYWQTLPWLFAAIPLLFARRVEWWWLCVIPVLILPLLKTVRVQVRDDYRLGKQELDRWLAKTRSRRAGTVESRPEPREMASR